MDDGNRLPSEKDSYGGLVVFKMKAVAPAKLMGAATGGTK
jgi:hypothetical protein